jgi:uncharacterized protein YdhG (YjbR/CyaY superfamily)
MVAGENAAMKPQTIEQYLAALPARTRKVMKQLRALIRKAAPDATEKLSYGMPTLVLHGNLVHYAGYEHHVGLYGARAMKLEGALAKYQTGKGTLRFELDRPLPAKVIGQLVTMRVAENLAKAASKKR